MKDFRNCTACGGRGFILADVDSTGKLEIQRCDECQKFDDDNAAVAAAFRIIEEHS